jgi:hypothetical protein
VENFQKLAAKHPEGLALAKKCPHFDKNGDAGHRRFHDIVGVNVRRVLVHAQSGLRFRVPMASGPEQPGWVNN